MKFVELKNLSQKKFKELKAQIKKKEKTKAKGKTKLIFAGDLED